MSTRYLEFFAGGGMVREGLGREGWTCAFANDFDAKKGAAYIANWGKNGICPELRVADVRNIAVSDLPDAALAWGSFPCQDLSLAGSGAGLKGERSGTFYPFWDLMRELIASERAPRVIAVENVTGALTSHGGTDFAAICGAFAAAKYRYGALVVDAALFVPQSRPRLFVVGVDPSVTIPKGLTLREPTEPFHTGALRRAAADLDGTAKDLWVWWNLPTPQRRTTTFADLIDEIPEGVPWHSAAETQAILAMMSPLHLRKVEDAKGAGRRMVGGIYKRIRRDSQGDRLQRAEVRFDGVAGCLRTPAGGSSRQMIVVVNGHDVRTRLISARETARLMGLSEQYVLPLRYNDAYHLTGDGVVVPVVRHLAEHLFERLLSGESAAAGSETAA